MPDESSTRQQDMTFDQFRERVFEFLTGFPFEQGTFGHAVFTWSSARAVEFNDAEPVVDYPSLGRGITDLLRRKASSLAAFVAPAFGAPQGGKEQKIVAVEVSDGQRTEHWMAPLIGYKLGLWREVSKERGDAVIVDQPDAPCLLRDAFAALRSGGEATTH